MKSQHRAKTSGFALIIVAVLLMLTGILIAGSLPVKSDQMLNRKNGTREKLDAIRQAMAFYYAQNSSLYPCPAARLTKGSTNYGMSQASCAGITPVSGTLLIGAVPVRTLNLPDSYMYDEWNNQFTYAIDIGQTTGTVTPGSNVLVVKDISGSIVSPVGSSSSCDRLKYLITSHGPDGYGAYGNSSTQSACTASVGSHDLENCDNDVEFRYDDWQYASGIKSYDDVALAPTAEDEGGSAGSSDAPPVTANMVLWLNGADNTNIFHTTAPDVPALDGETVVKWNSGCGVTNYASQATGIQQPIYEATAVNGKGGVIFDASDDNMSITSPTDADASNTTFVVFRATASVNASRYIWSNNNSDSLRFNSNSNAAGGNLLVPLINGSTLGNYTISNQQPAIITMTGKVSPSEFYANGMNVRSSSAATNVVKRYLGRIGLSVGGASGTVLELIRYSPALTDAERESVEVYLGNKWGIYVAHNNDIVSPFTVADNCPAGTTGCRAWYDASDPTTLFKEGGIQVSANNDVVATWLDKSGNQNDAHGLYAADTRRPLYKTTAKNGLSTVYFDSSNDVLQTNAVLNSTQYTIYTVYNAQSTYSSNRYAWSAGSANVATLYSAGYANRHYVQNTVTLGNLGNKTAGPSSYALNTLVGDATTAKSYFHGTDSTTSPFAASSVPAFTTLANQSSFIHSLDGNIAEVIVYPSSHDEATRKSVECYLGAKWGLFVPHCYVTNTIVGSCPAGVAGCASWYDGSDTDTIYNASGVKASTLGDATGVAHWLDKSGNKNDVYAFETFTQPLYYSNLKNSMSGLTFSLIGHSLQGLTPIGNANYTVVFVANRKYNPSNFGRFLEFSTSTMTFAELVRGGGGPNYSQRLYLPTGLTLSTIAAPAATFSINSIVASDTASDYIFNGNSLKTGSVAASIAPFLKIIGSSSAFTNTAGGEILEVAVYPLLLDSNRKVVECYMADKWWGSGSCPTMNAISASSYCSGLGVTYCGATP